MLPNWYQSQQPSILPLLPDVDCEELARQATLREIAAANPSLVKEIIQVDARLAAITKVSGDHRDQICAWLANRGPDEIGATASTVIDVGDPYETAHWLTSNSFPPKSREGVRAQTDFTIHRRR